MDTALIAAASIGAFIAYVNGANDVSKGIATLAGSGLTNYRRAMLWGAIWTGLGSIAAFRFAGAMAATFGKDLLSRHVTPGWAAAIATILGAGIWVGVATRFGQPVSTTHAIVGSVAGVVTIAYGVAGVSWAVLGAKVALPLLLSPFASLILTRAALSTWKRVSPLANTDCLCAEIINTGPVLASAAAGLEVEVSMPPTVSVTACWEQEQEGVHSSTLQITASHLHWLSSAGVSFARGLNDAPKMAALLLAASQLPGRAPGSSQWAYLLIGFAIFAGSLMAGRRVTTVLATKITPMDHRDGFIASLVTALLVGPGAALGLPMSTTHVASGAIVGVGLQKNRQLNWQTVTEMAFAWFVTLPVAALLGIVLYKLLRATGIA